MLVNGSLSCFVLNISLATMPKIVSPVYFRIYERVGVKWFAIEPSGVFYNPTDAIANLNSIVEQFGLKESKILIELFRVNGGKPGYYLVNLRDKKYYYCGLKSEDIKHKLVDLGIGRADPVEN